MIFKKGKSKTDNLGNILTASVSGELGLKLFSEDRERMVGRYFDYKGKISYYKKVNEKAHLMRVNNSWGINFSLIEKLHDDAIIVIDSEKSRYIISIREAKEVWDFRHFKTQGFEKQVFIPLQYWSDSPLN